MSCELRLLTMNYERERERERESDLCSQIDMSQQEKETPPVGFGGPYEKQRKILNHIPSTSLYSNFTLHIFSSSNYEILIIFQINITAQFHNKSLMANYYQFLFEFDFNITFLYTIKIFFMFLYIFYWENDKIINVVDIFLYFL